MDEPNKDFLKQNKWWELRKGMKKKKKKVNCCDKQMFYELISWIFKVFCFDEHLNSVGVESTYRLIVYIAKVFDFDVNFPTMLVDFEMFVILQSEYRIQFV